MRDAQRADLYLVAHGYAETRSEAQAAIRAGGVHANGHRVCKPSQLITSGAEIQFERAHAYVSRGGVKLSAALEYFGHSAKGCTCLDLGASTGGFTQVLLEDGATRVYAIDVGHGQLNGGLLSDDRVVSMEGVNARDLLPSLICEPIDAVVVDVSFISLKLVLPPALALAAPKAWAVVLVKPQFEVGREGIGKGGIVKNEDARLQVLTDLSAWVTQLGWCVEGTMPSPIKGANGNQEYLLAARPN